MKQDSARHSLGLLRNAGNSGRDLFRSGRLRGLYIHVVGAVRGDTLGEQTSHRSNIGSDFPCLVLRDAISERGHAVRPSLHYGGKDTSRFTAIDPVSIHERRADPAAAVSVTADSVVALIKFLSFGYCIRALLIHVRTWRRRD